MLQVVKKLLSPFYTRLSLSQHNQVSKLERLPYFSTYCLILTPLTMPSKDSEYKLWS